MSTKLITAKIIIFSLLMVITCSSGRKLQFRKPGHPSFAGMKRLAIAPCTGLKEAPELEDKLISRLEKLNYFFLFYGQKLDSILQKNNLNLSDIEQADSTALKKYGNSLKLDGILFSDLRALAMDFEATGSEKVERKVWTGEYERDELGEIIYEEKPDSEKVKKKKLKVKILDQQFQIRKAKIQVFFRLVDLDVGAVIESWDKVEHYVDNSLLGPHSKELPSEHEIKDILVDRLINGFVSEISPEIEFVKYPLETGFATLDSGTVCARNGDWNKALKYWQQAENEYPNSAKVYYNIGVAYEAVGDYKSAEMNYLKASLLNTDKKRYTRAVERIQKIWAKKQSISN